MHEPTCKKKEEKKLEVHVDKSKLLVSSQF